MLAHPLDEFTRDPRIAYFSMEIALRNQIPTYSGGLGVLAGWWTEGCIEGVTGWSIGNAMDSANGGDGDALYEKLSQVVLPLYYMDRPALITVMKGAMCKNASFFNSHRMMRRYATEVYLH